MSALEPEPKWFSDLPEADRAEILSLCEQTHAAGGDCRWPPNETVLAGAMAAFRLKRAREDPRTLPPLTEGEVLARLRGMRDSSDPNARYVARTILPGRDDGATCLHLRGRRGPGSAHAWVACADCGRSLGLTTPPEMIKNRIESLRRQIEGEQRSLEEALAWEQNQARGCRIEP